MKLRITPLSKLAGWMEERKTLIEDGIITYSDILVQAKELDKEYAKHLVLGKGVLRERCGWFDNGSQKFYSCREQFRSGEQRGKLVFIQEDK